MTKSNWIIVAESQYPWERDALDFVRQRFPDHEPYRAWSNFEVIADDGSINEVDLLALTPQGFFLVEIKGNPGVLTGDVHSWTWQHDAAVDEDAGDGRKFSECLPIDLANEMLERRLQDPDATRRILEHRVRFLVE